MHVEAGLTRPVRARIGCVGGPAEFEDELKNLPDDIVRGTGWSSPHWSLPVEITSRTRSKTMSTAPLFSSDGEEMVMRSQRHEFASREVLSGQGRAACLECGRDFSTVRRAWWRAACRATSPGGPMMPPQW
jgi:hypothetical protein